MIDIKENNKFIIKNNIEFEKIESDYILFLNDKKQILNLNSTASFLWEMILDDKSTLEIIDSFVSAFSTNHLLEKSQLQNDIANLLKTLLDAEAIEIVNK